MSDLLVERNGKLVARGLGSLAEILSLAERDIRHETEEMAVELLEALKGERAQSRPECVLAALEEEIARAAAKRTEAEYFVQELLEVRELQRSAEAELRQATANLAEAIEPLKEMVAQGEGLLSYGVQQDTICAVRPITVSPSTANRRPPEIHSVKPVTASLWPLRTRTQEIYVVNFFLVPPSVVSSPVCRNAHLPGSDSPTVINQPGSPTESLDRLAHLCYTIDSLCEWVSVRLPRKAA